MIWNYTHLSQSSSDGTFQVNIVYLVFSFCVAVSFSTLDRLLFTNVMDLRILLFGASSLGHLVPLLVCSRAASTPTPNVSFSMYRDLVSS